jgi:hypothetical protein
MHVICVTSYLVKHQPQGCIHQQVLAAQELRLRQAASVVKRPPAGQGGLACHRRCQAHANGAYDGPDARCCARHTEREPHNLHPKRARSCRAQGVQVGATGRDDAECDKKYTCVIPKPAAKAADEANAWAVYGRMGSMARTTGCCLS